MCRVVPRMDAPGIDADSIKANFSKLWQRFSDAGRPDMSAHEEPPTHQVRCRVNPLAASRRTQHHHIQLAAVSVLRCLVTSTINRRRPTIQAPKPMDTPPAKKRGRPPGTGKKQRAAAAAAAAAGAAGAVAAAFVLVARNWSKQQLLMQPCEGCSPTMLRPV